MILSKYIFKEILKVQCVTLIVLLAVFICQSIVLYVERASQGRIPVDFISLLVIYSVPSTLFLMLPLTLFASVLIAVGRISSDSELVVMRVAGYSTGHIMKIAMLLSCITAVVTAVNNLYLMPYSENAMIELRSDARNNPRYMPIESGKFVSFGQYHVYLEEVESNDGSNKTMGESFVLSNPFADRGSSFIVARNGSVGYDDEGVQWLYLTDANRYDPRLDGTYSFVHFENVKMPIGSARPEEVQTDSTRGIATVDLLNTDNVKEMVELQWRICPIFSCFILVIAAVPLSLINPRQSRFTRLFPAIFIYVSYYMLLLSLRNLINAETLPPYPGLYIVPLLFLIFVAIPLNLTRGFFRRKKQTEV
ncbi:MAG: LPS export ABC transporter permease LptF [Succinivibrio sp.]|nr:LPS export ABC transporter permease LptF [Succinivibrio sp.]